MYTSLTSLTSNMYLSHLIPAFLLFARIDASGAGVVGLGLTPFEPLCCYACLSSFWGLQLTCTTNSTHLEGRGEGDGPQHIVSTSPSCHATNLPYLESLAYCIQQKCTSDNVSSSNIDQCWANVAGDGLQVPSLENSLPNSTLVATQLAYNATTLNQTSLVNEQYYADSRSTIQGYVKQESAHALYGYVQPLLGYWKCWVNWG
jgi:hypothetical protein